MAIDTPDTPDDGTLRWWLAFADLVESLPTREARRQHRAAVRQAIGEHLDRLVRWNTGVCDLLDVAMYMTPAPRPSDRPPTGSRRSNTAT
ncbi:MAG TPA: hypothetical protein VGA36_09025 [Nitriliruptorales bacterium]